MGLARSGWSWDIKAGDFDNSGTDQFVQAEGFIRGGTGKWAQLQELAMGMPELLRFPQVWPLVRHGDDLSGHEPQPVLRRHLRLPLHRLSVPSCSANSPGSAAGWRSATSTATATSTC